MTHSPKDTPPPAARIQSLSAAQKAADHWMEKAHEQQARAQRAEEDAEAAKRIEFLQGTECERLRAQLSSCRSEVERLTKEYNTANADFDELTKIACAKLDALRADNDALKRTEALCNDHIGNLIQERDALRECIKDTIHAAIREAEERVRRETIEECKKIVRDHLESQEHLAGLCDKVDAEDKMLHQAEVWAAKSIYAQLSALSPSRPKGEG